MYDPRLYVMYKRDELMKDIDSICDERLDRVIPQDDIDALVTLLCDAVCERIDGV